MGLRVWDDTNDTYDNEQQADNWLKVDFHNHTPGRGELIPTGGIADGAITSVKLASTALQGTVPWTLIGTYSGTWDPASVASGASINTTVAVAGAQVGDAVLVSFPLGANNVVLGGHVSSAGNVRVVLNNLSGGAVDLGSATLKVKVVRFV